MCIIGKLPCYEFEHLSFNKCSGAMHCAATDYSFNHQL